MERNWVDSTILNYTPWCLGETVAVRGDDRPDAPAFGGMGISLRGAVDERWECTIMMMRQEFKRGGGRRRARLAYRGPWIGGAVGTIYGV